MSKRKFEGFGINRQTTYNFEQPQAPQRLYVPPSSRSRHDNYEDNDLDNIEYESEEEQQHNHQTELTTAIEEEVDPLDAFIEGIHEEMKAPPKTVAKKADKYRDDEEEDHMGSSFSRSAVNYMAGCKTAVSNIVMSGVVFLTLMLITPLFKYTPNAILSAIIISAVLGLIDIDAAILIWKIDKFDFVACMGAFFGVIFASVEVGLLIAVSISFAKLLLQVTRPRTALLGKLPQTTVYRNIEQYPDASKVPGILIVRVDSAIYFSNSNYIKERILRWLNDEEEHIKAKDIPKIEHLIVEMSPVTDIDTSGIHALEELYKSLKKKDIQLVLANPGQAVIDKLHASKLTDLIGNDHIFLTVADAVLTCKPKIVDEV